MSLGLLGDPNAELLKQLTRVANALDKTGPSPWLEWVKTLASFILGVITAYVSLWLQGRSSDRREQNKMRRVVYSELIQAFLSLDNVIRAKALVTGGPVRYQLFQDVCAFDGEAYMKANHAIFYGLPEGTDLTWMYNWLHKIPAGGVYGLVEMRAPLGFFCERFRANRVVRNNVKRFASRAELRVIEEAAKIYSRSATFEEMVESGLFAFAPRKPAEADLQRPDRAKESEPTSQVRQATPTEK
jgi:hypothetical protein